MQTLANAADVAAALGRALTAEESGRVQAILERLSALFRMHAERDFTPTTSTVRLAPVGDVVQLRQRPVVSVDAVEDDDGNAIAYTQSGEFLSLASSVDFAVVTYTHGADEVPALVRLTVADAARRALMMPTQLLQGVASHSLTTASISEQTTYSTGAQGGGFGLSDDEIAIARRFRIRRPRAVVQVP